jgi:hypothetical protein
MSPGANLTPRRLSLNGSELNLNLNLNHGFALRLQLGLKFGELTEQVAGRGGTSKNVIFKWSQNLF